jgi:hypothetical protein
LTDVSEVLTAFIIGEIIAHGIASQKAVVFIFAAVKSEISLSQLCCYT